MEKFNKDHLAEALGIFSPYKIASVGVDSINSIITVDIINETYQTGIFRRVKSERTQKWRHLQLGRFGTFVRLSGPNTAFTPSNRPVFMGQGSNNYSDHVQQLVGLMLEKSIDPQSICAITGLPVLIVKSIYNDLSSKDIDNHSELAGLPLESDSIWLDIILGVKTIDTSSVPLRFLISKLSNQCNKISTASEKQMAIATLRKFFKDNHASLGYELAVMGVANPVNKREILKKNKPQKKLTIDHPIWAQILTGKVNILSNHAGFTLLLGTLKSVYETSETPKEIELKLLSFLNQNKLKLTSEIGVIQQAARSMSSNKNLENMIPPVTDPIWNRIINGEVVLESSNLGFNLLVIKLKKYGVNDKSVQDIHKYVSSNKVLMKEIINNLNNNFKIAN